MLDDVPDPAVYGRRFCPESLPVSNAVGHQAFVVAHVDAIALRDRLIEAHLVRDGAGGLHGQARRPANGAGLGVHRPQAHQRVDDEHFRSSLQHFECRAACRGAHQSLHQAPESTLLRPGLLKQRITDPALRPGAEIVQRHDGRSGCAPAMHEQCA